MNILEINFIDIYVAFLYVTSILYIYTFSDITNILRFLNKRIINIALGTNLDEESPEYFTKSSKRNGKLLQFSTLVYLFGLLTPYYIYSIFLIIAQVVVYTVITRSVFLGISDKNYRNYRALIIWYNLLTYTDTALKILVPILIGMHHFNILT